MTARKDTMSTPTDSTPKPSAEGDNGGHPSPMSGSAGPRLRCTEKWENGFYGTYRKHQVAIERDDKSRPWTFLVIGPDGIRAADGVMRERTTMREAIIYALRGALLWPNTKVRHGGETHE